MKNIAAIYLALFVCVSRKIGRRRSYIAILKIAAREAISPAPLRAALRCRL